MKLFLLFCVRLFPESIRWLVVNNRPEEAEKIVLKAARWNGVTIPDDVLKRELVNEFHATLCNT